MPRSSGQQIAEYLAKNGFTSNPDGLVDFHLFDFVNVSDTESYLDINAQAVRRGDEVPDHPIRMVFRKVAYPGGSEHWEFVSAKELEAGVQTLALGRDADFPKISPWPEPPNRFQCPQFVSAGLQCVRAEGHQGPCDAGVNPYAKNGIQCIFCQQRFLSTEEFDAHAPCPKA